VASAIKTITTVKAYLHSKLFLAKLPILGLANLGNMIQIGLVLFVLFNPSLPKQVGWMEFMSKNVANVNTP
jgi:hypothetical protein